MKVVIIEDEELAVQKLKRMLDKFDPTIEVLAQLETVEDSINWLNNNTADLIFLDIHLGDSNSFSIFEKISVNTPIIFTTAYDEYALKAFQLNSVDYLLKPINSKELENALKKFKNRTVSVDYKQILSSFIKQKSSEYQKRFMVYTADKIRSIPVEDAAYFWGEGKYAYLETKTGQQYIIDLTLEKLETVLDPESFFRINRQFIIGISSIKEMHVYPKSRVKIDLNPPNKKEAIVSVERSGAFKKWLNR